MGLLSMHIHVCYLFFQIPTPLSRMLADGFQRLTDGLRSNGWFTKAYGRFTEAYGRFTVTEEGLRRLTKG